VESNRIEIESEAWYRAVAEGRLPAVSDRGPAGAPFGPATPAPGQGPAYPYGTGSSPLFGSDQR
jgi:hypothetical protein